jgi:decaprenylphospho-beta-D-ribofuranose 2-oxidase
MPAVDALAEPAPAWAGMHGQRASLTGWGGGPRVASTVLRPATLEALQSTAAMRSPAGVIARGMGRSYGDAAQRLAGLVIDTTELRAFELDPDAGEVTAQSGATLAQLLDAAQPSGWVLPVVPGTQHVSVGGAIASDIHGKNHGTVGTFGSHVLALGLLCADGEVRECSPAENPDLLAATLGGMGLTGIILWARIKLRAMRTPWLAVDTDRFTELDDALAILDGPGGSYRVAWLDLLARPLVRGVVTRADHLLQAPDRGAGRTTVPSRVTVPARWPGSLLQPAAVRAFNELRFRSSPTRRVGHVESFGSHMFPLDGLSAWPRLYGPLGFVQYQLVVPRGQETALEQVIAELRRSDVPCYLAVLKDFGPENHAPLSFPLAGWTLTLDMPRSAVGLEPLADRFDQLVAAAGGRVYLAKDWRLRPDVLTAMYPRLDEWRAIRERIDPEHRWRSDLGLRTGLAA